MKTIALLIAAMLVPAAYGQVSVPMTSARKEMEPPFVDVYTSANVRSEKVARFTAKAAELNKRRAALEEEGKKMDVVRFSDKYKNANTLVRSTDGHKWVKPLYQPPPTEDYHRRIEEWRREVVSFRNEVSAEFIAKRTGDAASAKYLDARQKAIADAVGPVTPAPVVPAAPAQPVAEAKPSSVPGFPAGVEPAKKATKDLPPGMSKR